MYSSKKIEYPPYYLCNGQYTTQSPISKGQIGRKNVIDENKLKYPPNINPSGSYRPSGPPYSVTTIETLRNYFENYGEIIDIYMPNDVCTNRPRGIAFVTFLDNDCVKKILSNKNSKHIIDGKEVVVDLADPETKSKKNLCY
ncbi:nucleic acid binding protein, putative [Plasmodium ovale wallikeri]|uniref:Nucleic acid binding protein, putative n=1 Tax=Plasmodium ovale wallikeri TaxID=864142 RepID=A0A1A8YUI2_PLAOA|nr:nucleic acid binding protein, putative [Plasmodium ovale wallikeri]